MEGGRIAVTGKQQIAEVRRSSPLMERQNVKGL